MNIFDEKYKKKLFVQISKSGTQSSIAFIALTLAATINKQSKSRVNLTKTCKNPPKSNKIQRFPTLVIVS
jgi:hypothetical protein